MFFNIFSHMFTNIVFWNLSDLDLPDLDRDFMLGIWETKQRNAQWQDLKCPKTSKEAAWLGSFNARKNLGFRIAQV